MSRRMLSRASVLYGVDAALKGLTDETAVEDADKLAEGSIRRIGTDAANRAPVDTGHLRNTMTSGIERSQSAPKGVWDLINQTDYTLIQEFNHKSKSGFIRNSVDAESPRFKEIISERFKKRN